MSQDRPYSAATSFEARIQESADRYAAAGYKVEDADIRKQRGNAPRFETLSPADWTGEPPRHDWMVDGCFLRSTVAMLSGDGGLGKSLLMQQLCTAAAVGKPWLGLDTVQCSTFAMFCEDDPDELQRRQYWINRHYECEPVDLAGKVTYAARVGHENVLMEFDRRTDQPRRMPLFEELERRIIASAAQIVILDTLADVFAGNEIIRNQVRRFVSALRALAMKIQGAVILTAHPSLAGMANKSGLSGSTAWNNSVRARLYLTRATDEMEEDNNERLLKTMKNNHGPFGGRIRVKWEEGVFTRLDQPTGIFGMIARGNAEDVFLGLLDAVRNSGREVNDAERSSAYAPKIFAMHPERKGLGRRDFEKAMHSLFASKRIIVEGFKGPDRHPAIRIVRKEGWEMKNDEE